MARELPDYEDFYKKGEKPKRKSRKQSRKPGGGEEWWKEPDDEAASQISSNLTYWAQNQRGRIRQLARMARFYGNMSALGYTASSMTLHAGLAASFGDNVTLNVSGSVTDTLVSKIVRNKPKPYFLTDNGDRKAQRVAKNRNTFLTGIFQENQTYAKSRIAMRDACVNGDGIIYIHPVHGRVAHTRVTSGEIFVDPIEASATGGKPRQMHLIRFVDRAALIEEHPEKKEMIQADRWEDSGSFALMPSLADLVCVRESWRLPSKEGADDGVYIKTISEGALCPKTPWKRMTYPFARMTYSPRMYEYWGQGLIEQGQSIQFEINKTAWTIQEGMHRMGTTKIWLGPTGTISVDQITNDAVAIIEGSDAPQYLSPPPVQGEYFQYLESLINRYYNLAGVSQMDATSTKPKGELSGEALREIRDVGTERFMSIGQMFEEFHVEIGRQSILTASDIVDAAKAAKKEGEKWEPYTITATQKGTSKAVNFDDLEFKPGEQFTIQCFPVSALPSDPAGRTQRVMDYAQAGWIDADTAREQIDFPDTGRVEGFHNASREFIAQTLDAVIDDGTTYTIEAGYDNVPLFLELATEYYQRFKTPGAGVSEARLQILRAVIDDAKQAMLAAQAPPPAAMPPANPTATPTSPLIPNVNL